MGKDSHFTGQPVYSQVLKLLDKDEILQISRETNGSEAYVKRFDGYSHLIVMLFGVLKHFDSLRELEIGMKAEAHKQPPAKELQGSDTRAEGLGKTALHDGFNHHNPF